MGILMSVVREKKFGVKTRRVRRRISEVAEGYNILSFGLKNNSGLSNTGQ